MGDFPQIFKFAVDGRYLGSVNGHVLASATHGGATVNVANQARAIGGSLGAGWHGHEARALEGVPAARLFETVTPRPHQTLDPFATLTFGGVLAARTISRIDWPEFDGSTTKQIGEILGRSAPLLGR